jgi:hypothetical protein
MCEDFRPCYTCLAVVTATRDATQPNAFSGLAEVIRCRSRLDRVLTVGFVCWGFGELRDASAEAPFVWRLIALMLCSKEALDPWNFAAIDNELVHWHARARRSSAGRNREIPTAATSLLLVCVGLLAVLAPWSICTLNGGKGLEHNRRVKREVACDCGIGGVLLRPRSSSMSLAPAFAADNPSTGELGRWRLAPQTWPTQRA